MKNNSNKSRCQNCDKENDSKNKHCSYCGSKLKNNKNELKQDNIKDNMVCWLCSKEHPPGTIYCTKDGCKLSVKNSSYDKYRSIEYPFSDINDQDTFSIIKEMLTPYKDILKKISYDLSNVIANSYYNYLTICQWKNKNPYNIMSKNETVKFIEHSMPLLNDLIVNHPEDLKISSEIMLGGLLGIRDPGSQILIILKQKIKKELKKSDIIPHLIEKIGLL